ncbi:hypothetical protein GGS23DRAFT_413954 [Durotheca rogersii]|uniref:uncharacterized protein n=1 Tax=Durotheca rogersii TaxID=419775 RepID=UPI00221F0DAF|nr:uncharacterized protein GGS23DRAFT_413954 [Durotheca rogersii]KAI5865199.1 hypothetical protein GGS23DRAFT_413954 [Durotheca rogersii]
MQATHRLLQACRITLFTRENCGLCAKAKDVLFNVSKGRPFQFKEIDIVKSASGSAWRDLYDFDVPVIHISKSSAGDENPEFASRAIKLMHRFTTEEVEAKMDLVERV